MGLGISGDIATSQELIFIYPNWWVGLGVGLSGFFGKHVNVFGLKIKRIPEPAALVYLKVARGIGAFFSKLSSLNLDIEFVCQNSLLATIVNIIFTRRFHAIFFELIYSMNLMFVIICTNLTSLEVLVTKVTHCVRTM